MGCYAMTVSGSFREVTIHFIRDLSGWAPQQGLPWEKDKEDLLKRFCRSLFDASTDEIFLIAANDGQLIESWRRLSDSPEVEKTRLLFEDLLVEDRQQQDGVRLRMFNLSRWSSADLFDRAFDSFINHPGWSTCYEGVPGEHEAFGPQCPIRRNYELLKSPLVHSRLRALIKLCDHNGLHLPIRQLLLLLSNAVLGHPDCRDKLRYAPTDDFLKALLYANVEKRMELGQFFSLLWKRYGLIFGDREAEEILAKDEFDKKSFQANARRLEQRLASLGLLKRLSDGCAYVINPYSKRNS